MGVGLPWSDQTIIRLDPTRDKQPLMVWHGLQCSQAVLSWEVAMPHYEFLCHACQKTFSKILALVDYEEGGIVCPHCGSHNVEQRGSAFSAITPHKKSA